MIVSKLERFLVFILRVAVAILMFGDPRANPMSGCRLQFFDDVSLRGGLFRASSQKSGSLNVVLAQIRMSFHDARIKFHGFLKCVVRLLGKTNRGEPT